MLWVVKQVVGWLHKINMSDVPGIVKMAPHHKVYSDLQLRSKNCLWNEFKSKRSTTDVTPTSEDRPKLCVEVTGIQIKAELVRGFNIKKGISNCSILSPQSPFIKLPFASSNTSSLLRDFQKPAKLLQHKKTEPVIGDNPVRDSPNN